MLKDFTITTQTYMKPLPALRNAMDFKCLSHRGEDVPTDMVTLASIAMETDSSVYHLKTQSWTGEPENYCAAATNLRNRPHPFSPHGRGQAMGAQPREGRGRTQPLLRLLALFLWGSLMQPSPEESPDGPSGSQALGECTEAREQLQKEKQGNRRAATAPLALGHWWLKPNN